MDAKLNLQGSSRLPTALPRLFLIRKISSAFNLAWNHRWIFQHCYKELSPFFLLFRSFFDNEEPRALRFDCLFCKSDEKIPQLPALSRNPAITSAAEFPTLSRTQSDGYPKVCVEISSFSHSHGVVSSSSQTAGCPVIQFRPEAMRTAKPDCLNGSQSCSHTCIAASELVSSCVSSSVWVKLEIFSNTAGDNAVFDVDE